MQLFTETFLLLKINAYSHDFIATKTCPSYEFLVVFGQVCVWDRKSAGRGRCGQNFLNSCGCGVGADTKFQTTEDSRIW